jgi:hypothetical protein
MNTRRALKCVRTAHCESAWRLTPNRLPTVRRRKGKDSGPIHTPISAKSHKKTFSPHSEVFVDSRAIAATGPPPGGP